MGIAKTLQSAKEEDAEYITVLKQMGETEFLYADQSLVQAKFLITGSLMAMFPQLFSI